MGRRTLKASCNASCEAFHLIPIIEQMFWGGRVLLHFLKRLRISNQASAQRKRTLRRASERE